MTKKINKKVLIVEDDPNFVSILKQKFDQEGFSVVVAQDGKAGFNSFKTENPDIVVSDMLLPLMQGLDMAKEIRKLNSEAPVIFLTNVKDEAHLDDLKKIKHTDYLIKSDVRLDDIVKLVKKRLNIK